MIQKYPISIVFWLQSFKKSIVNLTLLEITLTKFFDSRKNKNIR